jgi:hypothetical protein
MLMINVVLGTLVGMLLVAVPAFLIWKDRVLHLIKDPQVRGGFAQEIPMMGWEFLIGLLYLGIVFLSFHFWKKNQFYRATMASTLGLGFSILLIGALVLPKIAIGTQGAAIDFYQSMQGQKVYLKNLGFKTYATFFYARIHPEQGPWVPDSEVIKADTISHPVYFIMKVHKQNKVEEFPEAQLLYEKGGFAFYRKAEQSSRD